MSIRGLPRNAERDLIARNTFANPEFARRERLGLWTGETDSTIALYARTADGLAVPRGTLPIVIRICRAYGLAFEIIDDTICPPLKVDLSSGTLYRYQATGLDALLRQPSGLLEAPTGSGKTNMLLSVIPRVKTPTLILVHTAELSKQMRARCRDWLGVDPGAIGAGTWTVRPVTVAMIQTLARRDLSAIADEFGCVLVDECHHSPARSWAAILNQLPARYRYGFTATAWRKDGLQCLMWRTIGDVTAKIESSAVVSAGKIIEPEIETVYTDFSFDLQDSTEWTRMISALVSDFDRNTLIADEVRARVTAHTRALILSDRIDHVHMLAHRLRDRDPVILTGELTKAARETAMARVRDGASLTIATSSLLGEGVDVPGWDLLFLATPMAGGPRTLQAVGRISRAAPGKTRATVVDFVDDAVPALAAAHTKRVRLYQRVSA